MSHARPNQNTGASSLLVSDRGLIGTYTANAATVSKKRSVCEPVSMAHCVPPCTSKSKHGRVETNPFSYCTLMPAWPSCGSGNRSRGPVSR